VDTGVHTVLHTTFCKQFVVVELVTMQFLHSCLFYHKNIRGIAYDKLIS